MNMLANFKGIVKPIARWIKRHSTKLLAGGAIVSQMLGYYFMHKEAPIVRDRLAELDENATWKDKFKAAGPIYLPAAGMLLLSCGCIVGGCAIGEKRTAIMAGLYSASEAALRRTEQEIVKCVGEEKAQEIHKAVADDILQDNPVKAREIVDTGKGDTLFLELLTGRYFRSNIDTVKNEIADFRMYVLSKEYGSVNDYCEYLGLKPAKLGDYHGWSLNKNIDVYFDAGNTDDGELCWIIRHLQEPVLYNGKEPRSYTECESCYP